MTMLMATHLGLGACILHVFDSYKTSPKPIYNRRIMRYPQGSVQLLTAIFAFQVDPAVAHKDAPPSPRHLTMQQTVGHLTVLEEKDAADSGILSSTVMVGTRHGEDKDKTLRKSAGRRAMQGEVNNIFTLDSELSYCSEFIDCDNGMKRNTNITCFEACEGMCCAYTPQGKANQTACGGVSGGFTGKVCKDGKSCNGFIACKRAVIPFVMNSCIGDLSCSYAGYNGTVGNVTNSCEGRESCKNLGRDGVSVGNVYASCKYGEFPYAASCGNLGRSGKVGSVEFSCQGSAACTYLGRSGTVGNVANSCQGGLGSCYKLGDGNTLMGNVNASCNGEKACGLLGWNGMGVGNIENSCTGKQPCTELGISGKVGSIVNSCTTTTACASLGRNGTVGGLENSCNGENACESAGTGTLTQVGKITGGIENSCNHNMACMNAGQVTCSSFVCSALSFDERSCDVVTCLNFGGGIVSKLSNCCNSDKACVIADESSVPMACRPPTAEVLVSSHTIYFQ